VCKGVGQQGGGQGGAEVSGGSRAESEVAGVRAGEVGREEGRVWGGITAAKCAVQL
jgi:hypothetical protein